MNVELTIKELTFELERRFPGAVAEARHNPNTLSVLNLVSVELLPDAVQVHYRGYKHPTDFLLKDCVCLTHLMDLIIAYVAKAEVSHKKRIERRIRSRRFFNRFRRAVTMYGP